MYSRIPKNEGSEDHMHMHCNNIVSSLVKRGLHSIHTNNILGPSDESINHQSSLPTQEI